MKLSKLLCCVFIVLFCCFGWQHVKADITNPCAVAYYQCDFNGSGGVIVTIIVDYETATFEWLDCVTFNLPAGWTYVLGSEIGPSAAGNYISDAGNSVTFGTAGFCPGGGSGPSSVFGEGPNSFSFVILPPPGWDPGDCNLEGDGDPIIGITWDYAGDGYGEAVPSISGVNGDPTVPLDAIDELFSCTGETIPVDETMISACPQEIIPLGVAPFDLECGEDFFLLFDDSNGGTGGLAGGFNLDITNTPLPYSFNADLNGTLSANGYSSLGGTWCITGNLMLGTAICEQTEEICIVYSAPDDPACMDSCTANFGSFTDECDFIIPGPDCMLDQFVNPGNIAAYEIFYETDGSGSLDGIANASGAYTTGQDILNNINSGLPGEVVFLGAPGDCDGIPKPSSVFCEPFPLDVYIVPIEYDATGTPIAISPTCPVETITFIVNPDQDNLTYVETPGNCDTPATVTVGFDFGDGAGNPPDGDLDDPEDAICGIIESPIPASPPCDGPDNIETTPPLTATELADLLGFAVPECYTDVAATAEALCSSVPCSNCDDPCANNTGDLAPCTYDPDYNVCDDNNPNTDDSYDEANCVCINTPINTDIEVPTVGEWGLIILGLLMLISAVAGIRQRGVISEQILH